MKWIVTGGAGFIGASLASYLESRGDECAAADNFHRQKLLGTRPPRTVSYLDVRSAPAVDAFFEGHRDAEAVVHLAAQVSLAASLGDPRYDFETNALGTLNVLEAARRFTPRAKFIFAGTNKVYGDLAGLRTGETPTRYVLPDYPMGLPETLAIEPGGGYSCSKAAADHYVRDYARLYGLKTVVLRQSSIYGGHQYATEDQGWVAWFVKMAVLGRPFQISGSGKQVRDLLHVRDLCRFIGGLAEQPECSPVWGEAFNIGGGPDCSLSLIELFDRLREDYRLRIAYSSGPPRVADQKVFIADPAKSFGMLGWCPRINVDSGLAELVAWSQMFRETAAPESRESVLKV